MHTRTRTLLRDECHAFGYFGVQADTNTNTRKAKQKSANALHLSPGLTHMVFAAHTNKAPKRCQQSDIQPSCAKCARIAAEPTLHNEAHSALPKCGPGACLEFAVHAEAQAEPKHSAVRVTKQTSCGQPLNFNIPLQHASVSQQLLFEKARPTMRSLAGDGQSCILLALCCKCILSICWPGSCLQCRFMVTIS